jgi:hypothetical protein
LRWVVEATGRPRRLDVPGDDVPISLVKVVFDDLDQLDGSHHSRNDGIATSAFFLRGDISAGGISFAGFMAAFLRELDARAGECPYSLGVLCAARKGVYVPFPTREDRCEIRVWTTRCSDGSSVLSLI